MANVQYHPADRESSLRANALYRLHGRVHRLLSATSLAVILADVDTHHIYMVETDGGTIGAPSKSHVDRMFDTGEISAVHTRPVFGQPIVPDAIARMDAELELLDAARVRNGEKAIWLHLSAVWKDDLRRRFGEFDDPSTIRRWRTARRKAANLHRVEDASERGEPRPASAAVTADARAPPDG